MSAGSRNTNLSTDVMCDGRTQRPFSSIRNFSSQIGQQWRLIRCCLPGRLGADLQ